MKTDISKVNSYVRKDWKSQEAAKKMKLKLQFLQKSDS